MDHAADHHLHCFPVLAARRKSEDTLFDIVQDLAVISAKNRNLTLPEDEAAGRKAGEIIKEKPKPTTTSSSSPS